MSFLFCIGRPTLASRGGSLRAIAQGFLLAQLTAKSSILYSGTLHLPSKVPLHVTCEDVDLHLLHGSFGLLTSRAGTRWIRSLYQRHRQTDRTGQDRTDRQRSDSIGRTDLQTIAPKLLKSIKIFQSYYHKCTATFFMNHRIHIVMIVL